MKFCAPFAGAPVSHRDTGPFHIINSRAMRMPRSTFCNPVIRAGVAHNLCNTLYHILSLRHKRMCRELARNTIALHIRLTHLHAGIPRTHYIICIPSERTPTYITCTPARTNVYYHHTISTHYSMCEHKCYTIVYVYISRITSGGTCS